MSSINYYIANSTKELDEIIPLIKSALSEVLPIIEKDFNADKIDIIFISAANYAIPEYGVGGNSPGPNHIYISIDPNSKVISKANIISSILHEAHHCMRWRNPGYGLTLGEAMISEGLACLYEEQATKVIPLYAKVKIKEEHIKLANKIINSQKYDHNKWFFGSEKIDRWFGYTYGYKLCKEFAELNNKTASELVNIDASEIINTKN